MTLPSFLLTLGLFIGSASALSAPTQALGPVYPVIEIDLLSIIKRHAEEEAQNTSSRIHDNQALLKRWASKPLGHALPEAIESRRLRFDTHPQALEVLGKDYRREWLFINADNPMHLKVAQAFLQPKEVTCRVILVAGSIENAQKVLKTRLWFDQGGTLVKRLKIHALPAHVEMNATGITVTERPAKDFLKEQES